MSSVTGLALVLLFSGGFLGGMEEELAKEQLGVPEGGWKTLDLSLSWDI